MNNQKYRKISCVSCFMHLLTTSGDINCDKIMVIGTFAIKRPDTTSLLELERMDHLLTIIDFIFKP